jgi:hypothetical protein
MSYSFKLVEQLVTDLLEDGFTPEEITKFHSNGNLRAFHGVLRGTHEIKPIDHVIDLSAPARLPFNFATNEVHHGDGVVKLERREDDLYLGGKKISLFLSKKQQPGGSVDGYDLRKELEKRDGNLSAKVLDYLVDHPEFWPESWKKDKYGKTIRVFFWNDIFRSLDGDPCVRYGIWSDGKVLSHHHWLEHDWTSNDPTASLIP